VTTVARKRKLPPAGHCRECGEVLDGLRVRWCSSSCASRVYARARRIALDAYAPQNTACRTCNVPVEPGRSFCSPDCRAQWKAEGRILPSRYDLPEFYT